ncbi:MAG: hypothetical protein LBU94_03975, partial [Clostridiales bacterium]|nr:hypothetical protein [Clostridiales bacterium]
MNNSFLNIHQNFAAALSYVVGPLTGLFCYIGESIKGTNNKYVKFHALQSTIFFLACFAVDFVLGFFRWIPLMGLVISIFGLFTVIMWIYLIVSAFSGKELKIPVI